MAALACLYIFPTCYTACVCRKKVMPSSTDMQSYDTKDLSLAMKQIMKSELLRDIWEKSHLVEQVVLLHREA